MSIPHEAIFWLYSFGDNQSDTIPRCYLTELLQEPKLCIDALVKARLITEFRKTTEVCVEGDFLPVFEHPHSGKLTAYTDDNGFIDLSDDDLLHYQINTKALPFFLANMLERPVSRPPVERLPRLLWELGPVKCRHGLMPAWYTCQLVSHYSGIKSALRNHAGDTMGLLFSGVSIPDVYQNLPGIQKVLVVGESLDPWREKPTIDSKLLDSIFHGTQDEPPSLPFFMPPDKSFIRINTTGRVLKLRGHQREFFHLLVEQLKKHINGMDFKRRPN